jgi:hypothetical protein
VAESNGTSDLGSGERERTQGGNDVTSMKSERAGGGGRGGGERRAPIHRER